MYLEIIDLFVFTLFVCEIDKLKFRLNLSSLTCKTVYMLDFVSSNDDLGSIRKCQVQDGSNQLSSSHGSH